MRRWLGIRTVVLGLGLLAVPPVVGAQQTGKIPRIGYLHPNLGRNPGQLQAFRQGLRDLGYVEGRTLKIEFRDAEGNEERLPALAAELVALKVDVIVAAGGTLVALAAKQATRTVRPSTGCRPCTRLACTSRPGA